MGVHGHVYAEDCAVDYGAVFEFDGDGFVGEFHEESKLLIEVGGGVVS